MRKLSKEHASRVGRVLIPNRTNPLETKFVQQVSLFEHVKLCEKDHTRQRCCVLILILQYFSMGFELFLLPGWVLSAAFCLFFALGCALVRQKEHFYCKNTEQAGALQFLFHRETSEFISMFSAV